MTIHKLQVIANGTQKMFEKLIIFLSTSGRLNSPGLELLAISGGMTTNCKSFVNVSSE